MEVGCSYVLRSTSIGAAEGRDFLMHARIGMLRALNRHHRPEPKPSRKSAKMYRIVR
jgi:hypothetical protein